MLCWNFFASQRGRRVDGSKGSPGWPEASQGSSSALQGMSGNPLLRLTRDGDKGLKVTETKRSPIAPRARLILERPREGRREERALLTDILPDRRFDVAASQRVRGFVVGSHLVSSFVEMKLALSQEEESQRTVHRGNTRQRPSPACRRGISGGSDSKTGASGAPRRC